MKWKELELALVRSLRTTAKRGKLPQGEQQEKRVRLPDAV